MNTRILVCGEKITQDKSFLKLLRNKADVSILRDSKKLEKSIQERNIILVVFELSEQWENDLYLVKSLKMSFPEVLFVIVDGGGSMEAVIKSFRSGASDFFKRPYTPKLLAERVEALLKIESSNNDKN